MFTWLYTADFIGSIICLIFNKKKMLVSNIRNTVLTRGGYSGFTRISFTLFRKFLLSIPSLFVFNSMRSLDQHVSLGYPLAKCIHIPNGFDIINHLDSQQLSISQSNFNIAFVARFHPQKNHQILSDVFSCLSDINYHLHLVGPDILEDNIELKYAIRSIPYSKITLHGPQEQEFVHSLLKKCQISLLLSTFGEAFPNVVAESMINESVPSYWMLVILPGSCLTLVLYWTVLPLQLILLALFDTSMKTSPITQPRGITEHL